MPMIKITNGKSSADDFIKKLVATLKKIDQNGEFPHNGYDMTGLKIDPKKNLVTIYGGTHNDQFPTNEIQCFHLDSEGNVTPGEDGDQKKDAYFEGDQLIITNRKENILGYFLKFDPCDEGKQWLQGWDSDATLEQLLDDCNNPFFIHWAIYQLLNITHDNKQVIKWLNNLMNEEALYSRYSISTINPPTSSACRINGENIVYDGPTTFEQRKALVALAQAMKKYITIKY